ncbi:MAG TPA: hypothetical protein VHC98_01515 [Candidatus Saccharimonadales bacterium]|nr:hypothetical protein [Candidatus Saccharimonadales bacterium]
MLVLIAVLLVVIGLLAMDDVRMRMQDEANNTVPDRMDLANEQQNDGHIEGSAYTPDPIVDMLPEDLADAEDEAD